MGSQPRPSAGSTGIGNDETKVMSSRAAIEAVRGAVESWEGVTTHDHRFGGVEFRLGRRELGHLHGTIADLPFPRRVRDELIAAGRANASRSSPIRMGDRPDAHRV